MMSRRADLENLLAANGKMSELVTRLAAYPWDAPEELVELQPTHVISVLVRYLNRELSSSDVEMWANAIESREDIAAMGKSTDSLLRAIHELANPQLGYALTSASAELVIRKLQQGNE